MRLIGTILVILSCLGATKLGSAAPGGGGKEPIRADLTNVRGLNWLPTRPGLPVSNPIGSWRVADKAQQLRELTDMARLGANVVRVWGSMVVWEVEGAGYLTKLVDLYDAADLAGMRVELILFDGFGIEPSPTNAYAQTAGWVKYPGTQKLASKPFLAQARAYTRAVVLATRNHPAHFGYDLFNEPPGSGHAIKTFIPAIAQTIYAIDPAAETTVGHAVAQDVGLTEPFVKHVSFHPYGQFRKNVLFGAKTARSLAKGKPVVINEIGYEGVGQSYLDTLAYVSVVPKGMGFMIFDGIVTSHQFGSGTGFIGPISGKVRSRPAAEAFQRVARNQGIPTPHAFAEWTTADPDYLPFGPVPRGWDHAEVVTELVTWRPGQARLADWPRYNVTLAWMWVSFGYLQEVQPAELTAFYAAMTTARRAHAHGAQKLFASAMDRVVAMTAPIIEQRSSDSLVVNRYGAASSFPTNQVPMRLTAIELRDHRVVRLVGRDAPPNTTVHVAFGLRAGAAMLPVRGGHAQLHVDALFHVIVAQADANGDFSVLVPVELRAGIKYPVFAQAIAFPGSSGFSASNGVHLDFDPTVF